MEGRRRRGGDTVTGFLYEKMEKHFWMIDLPIAFSQMSLMAASMGLALDLSLRDIAILRLLQEHKGEVVSRDAFFDACWGLDFVPNSRTLDQHISQLRKRLEADPKHPRLIRTVHGAGYRYEG